MCGMFVMTALLAYCGTEDPSVLDYAIHYSLAYSEPLYILTVVREEQMEPDNMDESIREYMEAAQKKAASQGVTVHTIIETGNKPGEKIIEIAQSFKCDTIIMGRSNRSALDRLILGSVSNYVVKNAECHVILVNALDDKQQS